MLVTSILRASELPLAFEAAYVMWRGPTIRF